MADAKAPAPETNEQRSARIKASRDAFFVKLRDLAEQFVMAAPLSIPASELKRSIDRVVLAFRASANQRPEIFDCTPHSVAIALSKCALTGLMPGGANPEIDLIPRKSRVKTAEGWQDGPMELNWQIGFRGYITLAARAGCHVKPVPVFADDTFEWEEGLTPVLRHKPALRAEKSWGTLVAVYVVIAYADNHRAFRVLPFDEIEKRRNGSKAWQDAVKYNKTGTTPWGTNGVEMAMKTGIRYAAARGDIALDDVARYAMDQDRDDDIERNVVQTVPMAAAAPRAIAEQIDPLAGLEEEYAEPVRVDEEITPQQTASAGNGGRDTKPEKPKADPNEAPIAEEDLDGWAEEIGALEVAIGEAKWRELRNRIGVDWSVKPRALAKHGPAMARAYVELLGQARAAQTGKTP